MAIGIRTFQGERLTEARLSRGLFKKTLGDLLDLTGSAVTRYEDGTDKPLRDRVTAISKQLGFSEEFFSKPAWHEVLAPIFWRSRAAESKYAREMTEQRMKWICEIFNFLEQEVNFPALDLPALALPDDFRLYTADMIEDAADDVRRAWNLKDRPIPDMTLALENAGIPVINLEIPSDKQDGFCFYSPTLERPFVGVNTHNVSCARGRYDAAHELGHCVLHKNVTAQQEKDPALRKIIEQQAFRFAGAFLFPKSSFLAAVGYPSLDYFCNLKKAWGISIAAMIYRSHDLCLIDDAEKSNLYQNMGRRGWRGVMKEPFDSAKDMPLERPRMLRRAVETVLDENVFGWAAIQTSLAFPKVEIEQIIGVESGRFDSTPVAQLPITPRNKGLQAVDMESGKILKFRQR
jgi:Zn-dependent peptidase ImmA (M78 family)